MSAPLADQPAFPQSLVPAGQPLPVAEQILAGRGLTVRQHFAAMAMQSLLSRPLRPNTSGNSHIPHACVDPLGPTTVSKLSMEYADALIAALEEKK